MTEVKTRIKQKRDTSANWTAADPVLLNGEVIIVDTANGSVRKKVGDGIKKYSQLPFDDEELLSAIAAKGDPSSAVNATLTASGWINGAQALNISGLSATRNGSIGLSQGATDAQITAARNAGLFVGAQAEGVLTIYAKDTVPSIDIPVVVTMLY